MKKFMVIIVAAIIMATAIGTGYADWHPSWSDIDVPGYSTFVQVMYYVYEDYREKYLYEEMIMLQNDVTGYVDVAYLRAIDGDGEIDQVVMVMDGVGYYDDVFDCVDLDSHSMTILNFNTEVDRCYPDWCVWVR